MATILYLLHTGLLNLMLLVNVLIHRWSISNIFQVVIMKKSVLEHLDILLVVVDDFGSPPLSQNCVNITAV